MNSKIAGRLSTEAATFYRHSGEFAEAQVDSIDFALLHALHELMPDGAITAVFEHGGDGRDITEQFAPVLDRAI